MLQITVKKIEGTAQAGWFMAWSPWGIPILARKSERQAYEDAVRHLRKYPTPQMRVCGVQVKDV